MVSNTYPTSQFTVTSACSGTLAPGASCNIKVTFRPTTVGRR